MASFLAQHWLVISFYALVIGAVIIFRKKFEWQGKIVALLRTNWGIRWMERTGQKHARLIRVLGTIGIYVGFAGMLAILAMLVYGLWELIVNPAAPPIITPVLPGVQVPGSPIAFPLFQTLIALFIVIVVHESSHGLVAAAHGMKVESSGILILGPIFGAFVEPDEKQLTKKKHRVQQGVFAAGPFSNIILAIVLLGIWIGGLWVAGSAIAATGLTFSSVVPGSPAEHAGLVPGQTYIRADNQSLTNNSLTTILAATKPNDTFTMSTATHTYTITLGERSDAKGQSWIGIDGVRTVLQDESSWGWLYAVISWVLGVFYWAFILSLGLGLANLLPLGPVDGGRMLQLSLREWLGKKRGDAVWAKTSFIVLGVVLLLLLVPIIRALVTGA